MTGGTKGRHTIKYYTDYVVFDLETTGISWQTDRIVELAAVKVSGGQVAEEFSTLVNPRVSIPYGATQINGISDADVADAPFIEEVLPAFLEFIKGQVLVGHNIASFDIRFINRACEESMLALPDNELVDTLPFAKAVLPGLAHYRLTDLTGHFGISSEGAHRALNDCRMNRLVYEYLGKALENADLRCCPRCGSILVKRSGRFGSFWGCSQYPNCRYTEHDAGKTS